MFYFRNPLHFFARTNILIQWWWHWLCRLSQGNHLLNKKGKALKQQESCQSLPAQGWGGVAILGPALHWRYPDQWMLDSTAKGLLATDVLYQTAPASHS